MVDGAVGAVGGADGTLEGPFGGADNCGVVGPLTAMLSELAASVGCDGVEAGGMAGGSIR